MNLFYSPDLSGELHALNKEESHHCIKVLRLKTGDLIHLTDGKGNLWECRIEDDNPRGCIVRPTRSLISNPPPADLRYPGNNGNTKPGTRNPEPGTHPLKYGYRPYHLHIAIAPTKNIERFEWFLEKATEIGIDEITPLHCNRSERRHLRTDRLNKVITTAVKQSLKAWHPILHPMTSMDEFLKIEYKGSEKFIAYMDEKSPMLDQQYLKGHNVIILIGPEGDFDEKELEKTMGCGYKIASLGYSRLRTETAGVMACHAIYLKNFSG